MEHFSFDNTVRDPAVFAEGRLPARSDHIAYASAAEKAAGTSSLRLCLDEGYAAQRLPQGHIGHRVLQRAAVYLATQLHDATSQRIVRALLGGAIVDMVYGGHAVVAAVIQAGILIKGEHRAIVEGDAVRAGAFDAALVYQGGVEAGQAAAFFQRINGIISFRQGKRAEKDEAEKKGEDMFHRESFLNYDWEVGRKERGRFSFASIRPALLPGGRRSTENQKTSFCN